MAQVAEILAFPRRRAGLETGNFCRVAVNLAALMNFTRETFSLSFQCISSFFVNHSGPILKRMQGPAGSLLQF
jgi:hypothetical protein